MGVPLIAIGVRLSWASELDENTPPRFAAANPVTPGAEAAGSLLRFTPLTPGLVVETPVTPMPSVDNPLTPDPEVDSPNTPALTAPASVGVTTEPPRPITPAPSPPGITETSVGGWVGVVPFDLETPPRPTTPAPAVRAPSTKFGVPAFTSATASPPCPNTPTLLATAVLPAALPTPMSGNGAPPAQPITPGPFGARLVVAAPSLLSNNLPPRASSPIPAG